VRLRGRSVELDHVLDSGIEVWELDGTSEVNCEDMEILVRETMLVAEGALE
jgi:hypothetical protein